MTRLTARPRISRLCARSWCGTLIPAVLSAGINSDLPGQTTALVRRNVYDSRTGRFLLIPQGSRLVGEYDSRVAFGQNRVFVAWNRLIFPDGRSLDLGGMQGVDLSAAAGLRDKVNSEYLRRNLDIRPTIEVRPGYELNVEVTADLDLPGPYEQAAAAY